ncbi:MAG: fibronectin type III domain-containing protein, partial [Jatrophihabitantaceae bacterium]
HGFTAQIPLPDGTHSICAFAINVATGTNILLGCKTVTLSHSPTAAITATSQISPGVHVIGWATDPDATGPIHVLITVDSGTALDVLANGAGASTSGHNFAATIAATNGSHTVCVTAVNVGAGAGNSLPACSTIALNFNPFGSFDLARRTPDNLSASLTGWAIDPDTAKSITVTVTVDGRSVGGTVTANLPRSDVGEVFPTSGPNHGFGVIVPMDANEHTFCLTAVNVGGGSGNTSLTCRIINAIHPVPPSAPTAVAAVGGYGGAIVNWAAPVSDGGAPWTSYTVTSSPGSIQVTAASGVTTATVTGLKPKTSYTFTVVAKNVAGNSPAGRSPAVTTQASPPAQTSPAPISTSRYIRNIHDNNANDLNVLRTEGAADAKANPSGHGYLILLDIGGQDQADGGVVLSATTRFVTYATLVANLKAYTDGYASAQKPSAPVVIAIGTNNDMQVTSAAGKAWADSVVDPVAAYARKYTGMTIAGANDIEPGFRANYANTKSWLDAYLKATGAPFVFNGSADGCAWTVTNHGCNNGWSMAGLYYLAAGAAPTRILNLPQIYNNTMAQQWKYISLTGVEGEQPRINFGGALTEWTACRQSPGCGSLTGNQAWTQMWSQLQSSVPLKVGSLPYSTDLRIDS